MHQPIVQNWREYRHGLLIGVTVVLSCWLAWAILSNTAADTQAANNPLRALAWDRNHPAALRHLAEETLASGIPADMEDAAGLALRALERDPLNTTALWIIAMAADISGEVTKRDKLLALAARYSRRDERVQASLFKERLLAGDFAGAFASMDAMLRVWPSLESVFLPVFIDVTTDAEGLPRLISLLEENPPWRDWFMTRLPTGSAEPETLTDLYLQLKTGPTPPAPRELRPYLAKLVQAGHFRLAYSLWLEFLPRRDRSMLGTINNGSFEFPVSGLPFDWVMERVRGAEAEIVPIGGASHALRVQFHNTRVPFRHVSQLLLLKPGSYELTGGARSNNFKNARGLQWTVACAGEKNTELGESERIAGTTAWKRFEVAFTVPATQACEAQILRLVLPARIPAEEQAAGTVWYDDLRIAQAETETQ
jgi:hypothetical protein